MEISCTLLCIFTFKRLIKCCTLSLCKKTTTQKQQNEYAFNNRIDFSQNVQKIACKTNTKTKLVFVLNKLNPSNEETNLVFWR